MLSQRVSFVLSWLKYSETILAPSLTRYQPNILFCNVQPTNLCDNDLQPNNPENALKLAITSTTFYTKPVIPIDVAQFLCYF